MAEQLLKCPKCKNLSLCAPSKTYCQTLEQIEERKRDAKDPNWCDQYKIVNGELYYIGKGEWKRAKDPIDKKAFFCKCEYFSFDYKDFLDKNSNTNSTPNSNFKSTPNSNFNSTPNSNDYFSSNFVTNDELIFKNIDLQDKLDVYKKENANLKNIVNILQNENDKLKEDLALAEKTISNLNNKKNDNQVTQQENNNMIQKLNDLIKTKDKIINDLQIQLQNSGNKNKNVNFGDIIVVNFLTTDQLLSCGIQCLKTETFAEVEERLYQMYPKYREKNNTFLAKGNIVVRFKTISENKIQNQDKVQLIIPD